MGLPGEKEQTQLAWFFALAVSLFPTQNAEAILRGEATIL